VSWSEHIQDLWLDFQVQATSLPTSDFKAFALIKFRLLYFYFQISFV